MTSTKEMTNGEVYTTALERLKAFDQWCLRQDCKSGCPVRSVLENCCKTASQCALFWLDLKYEPVLKRCPFCGYTEIDVFRSECHGGYDACCKNCGATVIAETKPGVTEKWNRRV